MTQQQTKKTRSSWHKVYDWAHTYYGETATRVHIITVIDQIGRWYEVGPIVYEEEVFDKDGKQLDIDPSLPVYQDLLKDEYHGSVLAEKSAWQVLVYFQEVAHEQASETLPPKNMTYDLTKPPTPRKKPVTETV